MRWGQNMKQASNRFLQIGLVPLPWFIIFLTLAGMFAPDYNPVASHGSELSLTNGASKYLFQLAAIGSGAAFCIFGISLWLNIQRAISFGAICWIIFGISMISNGLFIVGTPMHGLYGVGIFAIVAPALSAFETKDASLDWPLYFCTIITSLGAIVYLWINLTGNDPEGYRGLTQRIFSSLNSLWPFVFALRFNKLKYG